eukprot:TRINITY_DN12549_c0_g1_i17.p1 TRINITY_DN12549_c0_g1~~TRINITY_DN12549_c0_g1_i17.p1  ORF type:complete len:465 (-),score=107.05 TRINITY_DN12549_c0_g1_i17:44-1438(-)
MGCGLSKSNFNNVSDPSQMTTDETSDIINDLEVIPHYCFKDVLGQGTFATVLLWESPETKHQFAVKAIPKRSLELEKMEEEIAILRRVDHPNIVKYMTSFQAEKYLYVIMEYCSGPSLFKKMIDQEKLSEAEAVTVMKDLLCAINHCHHLGIIHRDLKPENIMYSNNGALKIIDFGLSMRENEHSTDRVAGTRFYIAPEIVRSSTYTKACDIWSLGVIMYIILTGNFPIGGKTNEEFFANVLVYNGPSFDNSAWKNVSAEAKDLVAKMLEPDHRRRISPVEALKHPWFSMGRDEMGKCNVEVLKALGKYSRSSELKKRISNMLVRGVTDEQIEEFNKVFLEIDKDKKGLIVCSDLEEYLSKSGYKIDPERLNRFLKRISQRGEAQINYSEFIAAAITTKTYLTNEKLEYLFRLMDINQKAYKHHKKSRSSKKLTSIRSVRGKTHSESAKIKNVTFDQFKNILLS